MTWSDISVCDICGGKWQAFDNEIRCGSCGQTVNTETGAVKLDHSEPLPDQPLYEGQIGAPSPQYLNVFRVNYKPIIDAFDSGGSPLRVLELGAGVGRASQAFLVEYSPDLYIASEPFSSLTLALRKNLNEWGYSWPRGIAANYNGNFKPLLSPNAVNVVLGNSVLHHILEYESGLANWSAVLDNPGMMIFGEPIKEGWAYWTSIVLSMIQAHNMGGLKLSSQTVATLLRHSKSLTQRLANFKNREILKTLDDKHMFSPLRMMEVAEHLKMSLSIHKVNRNFSQLMVVRLKRIGISDDDVNSILHYAREIVPAGLEDTSMSDFAVFFIFKKDHRKGSRKATQ